MENKFEHGDIVFAKANPKIRLFVRRFVDDIYYCRVMDSHPSKELSFHEKDLMASTNPAENHLL